MKKPLLILILLQNLLEIVKTLTKSSVARSGIINNKFYYLDDNFDSDSNSLYMIEHTERKIMRVDFTNFNQLSTNGIQIFEIKNNNNQRFTHFSPYYESPGRKFLITCGIDKTTNMGKVSIFRLFNNDTMELTDGQDLIQSDFEFTNVTAMENSNGIGTFCLSYREGKNSRVYCGKFDPGTGKIEKSFQYLSTNILLKHLVFVGENKFIGKDDKNIIYSFEISSTEINLNSQSTTHNWKYVTEFRLQIAGYENLFIGLFGGTTGIFKVGTNSITEVGRFSSPTPHTYAKWIKPSLFFVHHILNGWTRIVQGRNNGNPIIKIDGGIVNFRWNSVYLDLRNILISFDNRMPNGNNKIYWDTRSCTAGTHNPVDGGPCQKACAGGAQITIDDTCSTNSIPGCKVLYPDPNPDKKCFECENKLLDPNASPPCQACRTGFKPTGTNPIECLIDCGDGNNGVFRLNKLLSGQEYCLKVQDENCLEAENYTEKEICKTCKQNFKAESQPDGSTLCKNTCKADEYFDSKVNECKKCSGLVEGCSSCSETACAGCQTDYFQNQTTPEYLCQKKCDENNFLTPEKNCKPIKDLDTDCLKAKDFTYLCTECSDTFKKILETEQEIHKISQEVRCEKICESTQFLLKDKKTCQNCPEECASCSNNGENVATCDSCSVGRFKTQDSKCLLITDLDDDCTVADDLTFFCKGCKDGFNPLPGQKTEKLEGGVRCEKQCKAEGEFLNKDQKVCGSCSDGCKTCKNDGNDKSECLTCFDSSYFLGPDGKCYKINSLDQDCVAAVKSSFQCSDCSTDFKPLHNQVTNKLNGGVRCEKVCNDNSFLLNDQKNCKKCSEGCKICINEGKDKDKCLTCNNDDVEPLFRDPEQQCQKILTLDQDCTSAKDKSYECLTCKDGYKISSVQNTKNIDQEVRCLKTCKEREYLLEDKKNCKICPKNCEECERDDNNNPICLKCSSSYWLNIEDNFCQKKCEESNYFLLEKNECFPCGENCTICSNNTAYCSNCFEDHMTNNPEAKTCFPFTSNILIQDKYFDKKSKNLGINFNKKIKINDFSSLIIKLKNSNNEITKESYTIEGNKLKIKIKINKTLEKATLEIFSRSNTSIENPEISEDYFSNYPITFTEVSYFVNTNDEKIEAAGKVGTTTAKVTTAAMVVVSYPIALTLIKLFQMIDFLIYVNVDLPSNAQSFISLFDQNFLKILPNPVEIDESELGCSPHEIFLKDEFTCYVFNSSGAQIFQLLLFLFLKFLFYILKKTCVEPYLKKKKREKLYTEKVPRRMKFIQAVYGYFSIEFFSVFLLGVQMDILMGVMVNLRYNFKFDSLVSAFNSLFSIWIYLGYVFFTYYLCKKIKTLNNVKNEDSEIVRTHYKTKMKSWLFLEEEYKEKATLGRYFIAISMIKDSLFPLLIVIFIEFPNVQIISITLCLVASLTFIIFTWPHKNTLENISVSVNSVIYIIVMVLFFILDMKKEAWSEEKKYKSLGTPITIFIVILVVLNILSVIILAGTVLYNEWQKRKKKNTKTSALPKRLRKGMREMIRREADKQRRRREMIEKRRKRNQGGDEEAGEDDLDDSRGRILNDKIIRDLKNFDRDRVNRVVEEMIRDKDVREKKIGQILQSRNERRRRKKKKEEEKEGDF